MACIYHVYYNVSAIAQPVPDACATIILQRLLVKSHLVVSLRHSGPGFWHKLRYSKCENCHASAAVRLRLTAKRHSSPKKAENDRCPRNSVLHFLLGTLAVSCTNSRAPFHRSSVASATATREKAAKKCTCKRDPRVSERLFSHLCQSSARKVAFSNFTP